MQHKCIIFFHWSFIKGTELTLLICSELFVCPFLKQMVFFPIVIDYQYNYYNESFSCIPVLDNNNILIIIILKCHQNDLHHTQKVLLSKQTLQQHNQTNAVYKYKYLSIMYNYNCITFKYYILCSLHHIKDFRMSQMTSLACLFANNKIL